MNEPHTKGISTSVSRDNPPPIPQEPPGLDLHTVYATLIKAYVRNHCPTLNRLETTEQPRSTKLRGTISGTKSVRKQGEIA
jgi:hypothetical protein